MTVSPGASVQVSVVVNGATYTASGQNFATYPAITAPAGGSTWSAAAANLVSWTGTVPDSTAEFAVGVLDLGTGALIWPAAGEFEEVTPPQQSVTISAGSLTAGSALVLVGNVDFLGFPGTANGSELVLGGFAYSTITITSPAPMVTLDSMSTAPATVVVGIGKSTQLTATGSFSDGSAQDITAQATWSSSNCARGTG